MSRQLLKLDFMPFIRARLNDPNSLLWSDALLQQLIDRAEVFAYQFINLTWIRFALNIQSGVGLYDLSLQVPTGFIVKHITRITYRGFKVDILDQKKLSLLSPVYRVQQSRPRWATWQFDGYNQLRLYPVPAENLPILDSGNDVYTDKNLLNECILSCYIFPSEPIFPFDLNDRFELPDYLTRRVVKYFVLWKAYSVEGDGQNTDIAQYFKGKLDKQINLCIQANTRVYNNKQRQLADVAIQRPWKKFRPILPPNFGTPVNM